MHPMNTGDVLDAIALMKAYLLGDTEALATLTAHADSQAMLTAVVSLTAGILARTEADTPAAVGYLDMLTATFLARVSDGGDAA